MGEAGSGWGERLNSRVGQIDYEAVAQEAVGKATKPEPAPRNDDAAS